MRNKVKVAPIAAGLLAATAALAAPRLAAAQDAGTQDAGTQEAGTSTPLCSTLTNPVFISGSSASKPVLVALAATLGANVSIIYQSPDSCLGVQDMLLAQPSTETAAGSPTYLNPNGTTSTCTLDTSNPQPIDIAVSDVFPATCANNFSLTIPSTVVEVQGPIQAMTIAVPAASNQSSISAQAAYVVFGADATTYTVAPWSVPASIFVRAETSGTLNMIGAAIGLGPGLWVNASTSGSPPAQQQGATGKMAGAVAQATSNIDATIGILSAEAVAGWNAAPADATDQLKILAFQANDQSCGYLPDSSSTALDKINVRQGRYAIWGPLHFLTKTTGGQPTGPDAAAIATVLNYFIATGSLQTGSVGSPAPFTGAIAGDAGASVTTAQMQALIAAEAKPGYVVPWCAMEAQRTSEVGAESSYSSTEPCQCFYETTMGATVPGSNCSTRTCTTSSTCTAPYTTCRYGYCEVQ